MDKTIHTKERSKVTEHSRQDCKVCCMLSHVQLFVTLWTVAHHAPLSMQFSRQEYWSGLPFPPPKNLQDQGSNPCPLHWQADSYPLYNHRSPVKQFHLICIAKGILSWGTNTRKIQNLLPSPKL